MQRNELLDTDGMPGRNPEFKPTQHHQIESQQEELKLESQQQQQEQQQPQKIEIPEEESKQNWKFFEKPIPIVFPGNDFLVGQCNA